jgi:hypothetical protein
VRTRSAGSVTTATLFFTPRPRRRRCYNVRASRASGSGGMVAPQVDQQVLRGDVPHLRQQRVGGRLEAVQVAGALADQSDEFLVADVPDHVPGRRIHDAPSHRPSYERIPGPASAGSLVLSGYRPVIGPHSSRIGRPAGDRPATARPPHAVIPNAFGVVGPTRARACGTGRLGTSEAMPAAVRR